MVRLMVCCSEFFCFKQKTSYELRICDWSSDVCSSDLRAGFARLYFSVRRLQQWRNAGNGCVCRVEGRPARPGAVAGVGARVGEYPRQCTIAGGTITHAGGAGNPAALELIAGLHPMKRMAATEEITQAAAFMLFARSGQGRVWKVCVDTDRKRGDKIPSKK